MSQGIVMDTCITSMGNSTFFVFIVELFQPSPVYSNPHVHPSKVKKSRTRSSKFWIKSKIKFMKDICVCLRN